jgi:hypothetical protein
MLKVPSPHLHDMLTTLPALGLLVQGKLSQYTHAIVPRLDDPNAAVRTVCLEVLGKLSQGGLLPHVSSMMTKPEDDDL